MDKIGHIEIRVIGNEGNNPLTPDNYDIREIRAMLENIEDILYPNKKARPDITYQISEGSVRNIFKTSLQAVVSFTAVAGMVSSTNSIDGLELPTAKAIENIQNIARNKDYSFEIKTSEAKEDVVLKITPKTNYERTKNLWIDAEFYLYGQLTNAGGKNKANIHLDTKEVGTVIIETDKVFLKDEPENLLYKEYGVRVKGKQNIETGEIDRSDLKLVELIDYNPQYDEAYLNSLIAKASPKFKDIDADIWLKDIRGGYDYE